jgi:gamma-glutamylcyclotransferase (GGCT)/AIG2-like uncharacterized protein YtfP
MTDDQLGRSFETNQWTHRVFVYGTLKRGHSNHALLQNSAFMGEAATLNPYWMITTGVFPIVLDAAPEGFELPPLAIAGEIYHCDDSTLQELDRLEQEGRAYDRKATDVREAGRTVQAHIYVGVAEYWRHRRLPIWNTPNARGELDWAPDRSAR